MHENKLYCVAKQGAGFTSLYQFVTIKLTCYVVGFFIHVKNKFKLINNLNSYGMIWVDNSHYSP